MILDRSRKGGRERKGKRTSEGRDLWDFDVSILCELLFESDQRISLDIVSRSTTDDLERVC